MGGYVQGQDLDLDKAMQIWPLIIDFLQQEDNQPCDFEASMESLEKLIGVGA